MILMTAGMLIGMMTKICKMTGIFDSSIAFTQQDRVANRAILKPLSYAMSLSILPISNKETYYEYQPTKL